MAHRIVEVSTRGTELRARNRQLVVRREGETVGTVPFEDLGLLVLSADRSTVSTGVLQQLLGQGGGLLVCDTSFMPAGMLVPLAGNALHAERLRLQVRASQPIRKRLWARIVRAKVRNQASALPRGHATARRLHELGRRVRSGDPANVEAQAARSYWAALFDGTSLPEPFSRGRYGPPPNGLLNYGYAVMRAAVARAVCAAGLHPALALFHSNRSNSFALADDLLEPLRPFVDLEVLSLVQEDELDVTPATKRRLLGLLSERVDLGGVLRPLDAALQAYVSTLLACLRATEGTPAQRARGLALPRLPPRGRE